MFDKSSSSNNHRIFERCRLFTLKAVDIRNNCNIIKFGPILGILMCQDYETIVTLNCL